MGGLVLPSESPRRRDVDIRRLPYGLGYVISLTVVAFVIGLAWLASRGEAAPFWWDRYASPAILWISPVAFALLVWRYVHRWRAKEKE
jgi:hypothetical protein